jgi:hypothetical protein
MKARKSKSAEYYAKSPEARAKKAAYDTEYHSTPERRKYRSFLNKKNREAGTYGNGDGKDVSHKKDGGTVMENQSANRARNRGKK